jgi:proline iminopeptidase
LLRWLDEGLHSEVPQQALERAQAWRNWETSLTARQMTSRPPPPPGSDEAAALLDLYRVQSHYLMNHCFWGGVSLLKRSRSLGGVATAIVHGRLDWICLPQAAWDLHHALPGSRLQWVDGCGHNPYEPALARAFGQAVAHYALHGDFKGWGSHFPETATP